jgi:hypothetical protein
MYYGIICDMFWTYVQNVSDSLFVCFILYTTTMTMLWYYFVRASTIIKVCFPMAQDHIQVDVLHVIDMLQSWTHIIVCMWFNCNYVFVLWYLWILFLWCTWLFLVIHGIAEALVSIFVMNLFLITATWLFWILSQKKFNSCTWFFLSFLSVAS